MHCKTILLILLCISIGYIIGSKYNSGTSNQPEQSAFDKLTTSNLVGKMGQKIVIGAVSKHNEEKRDRSFLEKNIRNLVMETGQTGKNVEMISEFGEAGVHYVIDKANPVVNNAVDIAANKINKIKEYSKSIDYSNLFSKFKSTVEPVEPVEPVESIKPNDDSINEL